MWSESIGEVVSMVSMCRTQVVLYMCRDRIAGLLVRCRKVCMQIQTYTGLVGWTSSTVSGRTRAICRLYASAAYAGLHRVGFHSQGSTGYQVLERCKYCHGGVVGVVCCCSLDAAGCVSP